MRVVDLGLISFEGALREQERAVLAIHSQQETETLFFVEHPHTFTTGRRGQTANLLARRDCEGHPIQLLRTNRGGDVTYHGPGQLVGYLHLDLQLRGRDLNRYLRQLEACLIESVSHFGVAAFRQPGLTGVWTRDGKLASIGIGVRRWVTMHGFALNVNTDLRYFDLINPCGLRDCPVTSLEKLTGREIPLHEVKQALRESLLVHFHAVRAETLN